MKINKAIDAFSKIAKTLLEVEEKTPVLKYHSVESYQEKVDLSLQKEGCTEAVFFEMLEQITLLTPRTGSSAFFNQLFAGRSGPSLTADLLASMLNTTMHTYKVAGVQVLLEQEVIAQMLDKIGFGNGEGMLHPGGSMSNMMSMMLARNEKDTRTLMQGIQSHQAIVYTSEACHYSVRKNAGILGLGKNNVRLIKTDDRGRMDLEDLEQNIQQDLAQQKQPFYINATAGTTVLGAYDPLEGIAAIAKKYKLWMHVDGALGASALMSARYKHLLKGIDLADSVTWNAHKMMNVPLTASFLLLKESGLLAKHLSEKAEYLFQEEEADLDFGNRSIQCGRRIDAFKVWAAWKYFGMNGIGQRVDHLFNLAKHAEQCILKEPLFELFRTPESVNVCFTIKETSPEEICRYLHHNGQAMVGYSKAKGVTFVRMACLNADLSFEDVDRFFLEVKKAALELVPV